MPGGFPTKSGHLAFVSGLVTIVLLIEIGLSPVPQAVGRAQAASSTQPTLTIGFLEAIDSLNPFRGLNDPSYLLYGLVYDYLFAFDQDGNVVPNLATSAGCTDASGKLPDASCQNWTYTIRQNVMWSDNTAFTAADVNFTFNYNIQNFFQLWAFEPYVNRVVQCAAKTRPYCGAVQTGQWQVTLYFDRPFAPGRQVWLPIIQQKQWAKIAGSQAQYHFQNPNPIGTGAFIADPNIYTEWLNMPTSALHLYRNPNYHTVGAHTGLSNVTDIYLEQFKDETSMENALLSGDIDLAKFTSKGYLAMNGQPGINAQESLEATQYWNEIGISQVQGKSIVLNPVRFDINFRQALAKATNKDYIIQQFYDGKGYRGTDLMSYVTPQWWYDPVKDGTNLTYSLNAANAQLSAAGYTSWVADPNSICSNTQINPGANSTPIRAASRALTVIGNDNINSNDTISITKGQTLTFTMAVRKEFDQEVKTAKYLQTQYCKIGVSVVVNIEAESALSNDVYGGAVELYIWYWSGDPDPNYLLSIQSGYTLDGWNDNFWNNWTYNRLYVDHLAALNPTTRGQIVQEAQRVHYQSAVYIIYIYPFGEWAWRDGALDPVKNKWTGWGDWVAHPFRQMDAFWGANPLFFDLTCASCTVNPPPSTPTINGQSTGAVFATYTNTSFQLKGESNDPDSGETLTFYWDFGDGNTTSGAHPNPTGGASVSDFQNKSWPVPGNYSVSLRVADGTGFSPSTTVYVNVTKPPVSPGDIVGFVKATDGTPINGASVSTNPATQTAPSNSAGAYAIVAAAGTYDVTADATNFVPKTIAGQHVSAGAATWVNFTLEPNVGWLVGRVSSSAGGGIASAPVLVSGAAGFQKYGVANAQGDYNVSVEPGTYSLTASPSGYVAQTKTGIAVTLGSETRVDFTLALVPVAPLGLSPLVIGAIVLAVAVAAIAVVAVFLTQRRRRKEEMDSRIQLPPK